jgi:hypothetical protein
MRYRARVAMPVQFRLSRTAMNICRNTIFWFAAVLPLPAFGQQLTHSDPTDAAAPAAAISYESAFSNYTPDLEVKPAGWRQVNDEAGQVGGHAGHMRGATGGADSSAVPGSKPASAPSTQPDEPAAGGHAGHRK